MRRTAAELGGLAFPESARWHGGHLWFAEKRGGRVVGVDAAGRATTAVEVAGEPGGLGWDPDGRLLVVSMVDRRLLRIEEGARGEAVARELADLSGLTSGKCNDLVVDGRGHAYVGHFGYDLQRGEPPAPASLILVRPGGDVEVAADGLEFPNGCAVTPDGATLIVAETQARRLTAFDVDDRGALWNRRVFADLAPTTPDGICLDAEGCVWLADPLHKEVVRVREGGEVVERVSTGDQGAFACALGGEGRRTLYVCTYSEEASLSPEPPRVGRIEQVEVGVPGAGWP